MPERPTQSSEEILKMLEKARQADIHNQQQAALPDIYRQMTETECEYDDACGFIKLMQLQGVVASCTQLGINPGECPRRRDALLKDEGIIPLDKIPVGSMMTHRKESEIYVAHKFGTGKDANAQV